MAFITKAEVKAKAIKLKQIAKRYGIKLSVSGSNSSTIKVTIQEGCIDFFGNHYGILNSKQDLMLFKHSVKSMQYMQVNHYYLDRSFSDIALECLEAIKAVLYEDHWDASDIQTDYFHCSWYIAIHIGRYDKPYKVI